MDTRTVTLVLVLLYFSAMATQAEDATTEGDDHHIKTKRHLLVVKREEEDKSGESQSDEEISFGSLKRSIQDDLHRPINDDTDSLGPLVAKLHQKRCARTTTTAATTTTTAAASG